MTDEINVLHRDQTIFVEPASGAISVIAAGPQGPPGPPGAASTVPGPPGPAGAGTNTPKGIIVSGAQNNQPAVNALLNLSVVQSGPASWLAGNTITLPVGSAGLYLITLDMVYRSDGVVGIQYDIANSAGVSHNPFMSIAISHNPSTWNPRYQGAWLRQCTDGMSFQVRSRGNAPASPGYCTVNQLSLVRLGDGFSP